jgi:nicotinamide mononucleotide (NMN) deamidase PncC
VVETFTRGLIAARLAQPPCADIVFRRGLVAQVGSEIEASLGLTDGTLSAGPLTEAAITEAAGATLRLTGATHALVVLADHDTGVDPSAPSPTIWFAIASGQQIALRCSRPRLGGWDWLRVGAAEMGLDSLRRFLHGLPVSEQIDFEKAWQAVEKVTLDAP